MRSANSPTFCLRLSAAVLVGITASGFAHGDLVGPVLLRINVSNPGTVIVDATGISSAIDDATANAARGVSLDEFFTSDVSIPFTSIAGTLTATGVSVPYNEMVNDFALSFDLTDLNLTRDGSGFDQIQQFSTESPAFTGIATLDLTPAVLVLPSVGSYGDIFVGDTVVGSGSVIGQWVVVPEPSAFVYAGAAALVAGGLMHVRRGRKLAFGSAA